MLKIITPIVLLSFIPLTYAQENSEKFSEVLEYNIGAYISASNKAYVEKNEIEGRRLFDSLVTYKLIGTHFDDFTVKNLSSKKITLNKLKKPVFIITYASWCLINKGDIPAINKLSEEQNGNLQILIFFWGNKNNLEKTARLFNKKIQICYTDRAENYELVKRLKNSLGFPTSYFIDANQKVVSINRVTNPYMDNVSLEEATQKSYEKFTSMIQSEAIKNNSSVLSF